MHIDPTQLKIVEQRLLWLSHWMIHHANHVRPKVDGIKIGGHQASSASMVSIMTALYFSALRPEDRVAVKPVLVLFRGRPFQNLAQVGPSYNIWKPVVWTTPALISSSSEI